MRTPVLTFLLTTALSPVVLLVQLPREMPPVPVQDAHHEREFQSVRAPRRYTMATCATMAGQASFPANCGALLGKANAISGVSDAAVQSSSNCSTCLPASAT
jgi:hypothetical protein